MAGQEVLLAALLLGELCRGGGRAAGGREPGLLLSSPPRPRLPWGSLLLPALVGSELLAGGQKEMQPQTPPLGSTGKGRSGRYRGEWAQEPPLLGWESLEALPGVGRKLPRAAGAWHPQGTWAAGGTGQI